MLNENSEFQPLVSVVIPCYNDGKYLEEAVQSVLSSSYKNVEIIIVNDGSVDETREVGTKLQQNHTNIIYIEQENKGPAAARNNGISVSKGDYILPLDADDKISVNYLRNAVEKLDSESEVKVVYAHAEFFGNKNGSWKLPEFDRNMLARENMIFSSAMYRRTDFVKCGGYSEVMVWGWEDWEFWISMLKNGGKVYRIPEVCFYYRIKSNSRRKGTNKLAKKKTVDFINSKHIDFMNRELNGPLHYNRSLSKVKNNLIRFFRFQSN